MSLLDKYLEAQKRIDATVKTEETPAQQVLNDKYSTYQQVMDRYFGNDDFTRQARELAASIKFEVVPKLKPPVDDLVLVPRLKEATVEEVVSAWQRPLNTTQSTAERFKSMPMEVLSRELDTLDDETLKRTFLATKEVLMRRMGGK